jgi:hypothetical protein
MWGSRRGKVSRILVRMARCALDLTLDFAPAEMLWRWVSGCGGWGGGRVTLS